MTRSNERPPTDVCALPSRAMLFVDASYVVTKLAAWLISLPVTVVPAAA